MAVAGRAMETPTSDDELHGTRGFNERVRALLHTWDKRGNAHVLHTCAKHHSCAKERLGDLAFRSALEHLDAHRNSINPRALLHTWDKRGKSTGSCAKEHLGD